VSLFRNFFIYSGNMMKRFGTRYLDSFLNQLFLYSMFSGSSFSACSCCCVYIGSL